MAFPNGIQRHALWTMDGRTWIEVLTPKTEDSKRWQFAVENGYARVIPQDMVNVLVATIIPVHA